MDDEILSDTQWLLILDMLREADEKEIQSYDIKQEDKKEIYNG